MLTLQKIRQIDPKLANKSDAELEDLRLALYNTAQLSFDIWWAQKQGSKNPVGLFPDLKVGAKLRVCKKKRKPE